MRSRPNLEGLFNGSAAPEPQMTWLNGQVEEPQVSEPPAARRAGPGPVEDPAAPEPTALFDPVAIAERYFAVLQALLDLQRDFGLRLARQFAALPPMNRLRH